MNVGGSWAQRQVVLLTALKAAREGKNFHLALALTAQLKVGSNIMYTIYSSTHVPRIFLECKLWLSAW